MIELINEESTAGDIGTAIRLDVITEETTILEIIAVGPQGPSGTGEGGGGTVTSLTATSPIIVTPNPITDIGVISFYLALDQWLQWDGNDVIRRTTGGDIEIAGGALGEIYHNRPIYFGPSWAAGNDAIVVPNAVNITGLDTLGNIIQFVRIDANNIVQLASTGRSTNLRGTTVSVAPLTTNGFVKTSAGTGLLSVDTATYLTAQTQSVTLICDGSGSALSTGTKNPIKIPYGGTLTGWLLIGTPSGSVTVDILRAANGAGLPVTSIVGAGTKPALSSAVENSSTSFAGWTSTTLTAKDNLAISLSGITATTYVALTLYFS